MQIRFAPVMLAILVIASHVHSASIVVVPDDLFQGKRAQIRRLMPDGNSIMGVAGDEVFRWTKESGRTSVGHLGPHVIPTAISGDGTTIVGRYVNWNDTQAIRWTVAGGLELLPRIAGLGGNSSATHVSDDGSIVYGTANLYPVWPVWDLYSLGEISFPFDLPDFYALDDIEVVFRWDNASGTQPLAQWSKPVILLSPQMGGISADGQTMAGVAEGVPVLQTEDAGPVRSPIVADEFEHIRVSHLSADGTTVIGTYSTARYRPSLAFRWKQGERFEPLTDATEYSSKVSAVSADGRTVLGRLRTTPHGDNARVIWQGSMEAQTVHNFFAKHGVDLPFPGVHDISEMSRDGLIFLGYTTEQILGAENAITYRTTQWIVDLTAPVPEPTSIVSVGTSVLTIAFWRRRTRKRRAKITF